MKPSAELRWFFKGRLPQQVRDWFCGAGLCKEETSRTDHYLVFPGSSEVGVKVREARKLEVKARTSSPEPFVLVTGASVGRQDAWVKWKHEDNEVASRLAVLAVGSADWVAVTKKRRLRKFRIGRDRNVDEVDPEVTEGVHCRVELTELDVRGSAWWTLAFDSFGDDDRAARLEQVARHFLKVLPHGLALTEHDSMAYPEWLNRVANPA